MAVLIYGTNKSQDTRKALRFFKERRVEVQFFDLARRPASAGELRRFAPGGELGGLADPDSKRYRRDGLEFLRLGEEAWLERFARHPELLRQPLLRAGNEVAVGWDEARWRRWIEEGA